MVQETSARILVQIVSTLSSDVIGLNRTAKERQSHDDYDDDDDRRQLVRWCWMDRSRLALKGCAAVALLCCSTQPYTLWSDVVSERGPTQTDNTAATVATTTE